MGGVGNGAVCEGMPSLRDFAAVILAEAALSFRGP
jgi:hypothetical protein